MMWHEARKQEKKLRTLMVDYRKRADRRRQFYEKIKLDPAQFLRIYGRPIKVHLEQSVALAAESPQSMMAWQGDPNIMIDRFDVRAHLDLIPEYKPSQEKPDALEYEEDRIANYERYRILVQNECAGVREEQCLQQIHIDELYGAQEEKVKEKEKEEEKKKHSDKKAAIGFSYEDTAPPPPPPPPDEKEDEEDDDSDLSDDEVDLDAVFDITKLTTEQTEALNLCGVDYGMMGTDFFDCLWKDKEDAEELRMAKLMEEEKAQYSGRKSRRERRAYKEKKLKERFQQSPPSYAARDSPKYDDYRRSSSRSRSRSPEMPERTTFITSFGGSDDEGVVQGPMLPPHLMQKTSAEETKVPPKRPAKKAIRRSGSPGTFLLGPSLRALAGGNSTSKSRSRSRSKSRTRSRRSRSRSRSSWNRPNRRSRSRSRNRSRGSRSRRSRSYSRSRRSRSRGSRIRRSRSNSRFRSRSKSRSRSRGRYGGRRRSRSRSYVKRRGRYGNRSRSRSKSRGRIRSRSRDRRLRSRTRSRSRARKSRSRSRGRKSYSRSRSKSKSRSRSRSRSHSRSKSPVRKSPSPQKPVIKRYRRPSLDSSNESESESDTNANSANSSKLLEQKGGLGKKDGSASKPQPKLTAAEKLKKRMQAALNRQYKADKKREMEKIVKQEEERMDREEELRTMAIQMRRREREKRHKEREELETWDDTHTKHKRSRRSRSKSSRSRSRSRQRRRSRSSSQVSDEMDNGDNSPPQPARRLVDY